MPPRGGKVSFSEASPETRAVDCDLLSRSAQAGGGLLYSLLLFELTYLSIAAIVAAGWMLVHVR